MSESDDERPQENNPMIVDEQQESSELSEGQSEVDLLEVDDQDDEDSEDD